MIKVVRKGWAMAGATDAQNGLQGGPPGSALLAMRTHHIVQRFVCLAVLRQVCLSLPCLRDAHYLHQGLGTRKIHVDCRHKCIPHWSQASAISVGCTFTAARQFCTTKTHNKQKHSGSRNDAEGHPLGCKP
jgi:hypothetical protein